MDDIGTWLDSIGLGQYRAAFAANDIDSEVLADLTERDFERLGCSFDHQVKLLNAIRALRSDQTADDLITRTPDDQSPGGAERRQLTVFFCHLVDSAEIAARLDPDDYRSVTVHFLDSVADVASNFGGYVARYMGGPVAEAAIRRLFEQAHPGERINVAFLGGEPLTNQALVREATELAARLSVERSVPVGFAITTNGTLLTPDAGDFFERYGFSVTVSIDGIGAVHDELRPYKGGRGSYGALISRLTPLLAMRKRMSVAARVTVTPRNLGIRETLDHLIGLGFDSVGFSPMLSAPSGRDELMAQHLKTLLDEMIECGREFERRVVVGEHYPFANMMSAMQEIHRGTHRPYPCGAGAGYFGVSADGGVFPCHRFVDDVGHAMGDVRTGVDRGAQRQWLRERRVERQEPCRTCWARYLCGGGCHHEVIYRGRPACDLIRGWLHYCLQAYVRLQEKCPTYFAAAAGGQAASAL